MSVPDRSRELSDPRLLTALVRGLPDGIYLTTAAGEILETNPAFLALFGARSLDELPRHEAALFPDLEDGARRTSPADEPVSFARELTIRTLDGAERTVRHSSSSVVDDATGARVRLGAVWDITSWKRLAERLVEESRRDPLTGCYNRRHLDDARERLALEGGTWGCIVLDVDGFKALNDRYGHDAGDRALVTLSRFLLRRTRADERVVRLGGDEFLLLLDGVDEVVVEHVADRLRLAASREEVVPFSIGWAAREGDEPLDETIRRADQRLLAVKSASGVPKRRRLEAVR